MTRRCVGALLVCLALLSAAASSDDCQILEQLYYDTGGPTDWIQQWPVGGASNCCDWHGVSCTEGSVTNLTLVANGLTGSLSSSIGELQQLVYLNIYNNPKLGGVLPEFRNSSKIQQVQLMENALVGTLPLSWSELPDLTALVLYENELTGTLPAQWASGMPYLQVLSLSYNRFHGELPAVWSRIKYFSEIGIIDNEISGSLPSEWSAMQYLTVISLGGNIISSSLPSEWAEMQSLEYMYLYGNNLNGTIPSEYGNFRKLQQMFIHENDLTGPLPSSLSSLTNLTELILRNNRLEGGLPSAWSELRNVLSITLSSNNLNGTLPVEWGQKLSQLQFLSLYDNDLTGTLPQEWSQLKSLTNLYLAVNDLTGPLPSEWSALSKTTAISLSENRLNSTLPPEWSELKSLEQLSLSHNDFTGSLPSSWANLPNLEELYLRENRLSGSLPASWENFPSIVTLDIRSNLFEGTLPAGVPYYIIDFSADGNLFSSTPEVFQLPTLEVLSLAFNPLGLAAFPDDLGSLTDVDLSGTNITLDISGITSAKLDIGLRSFIVGSNPLLIGEIQDFFRVFPFSLPYRTIDFSDCGLNGNLSSIRLDSFPFLETLNVAGNTEIVGAVPTEQLRQYKRLELIVSGTVLTAPPGSVAFAAGSQFFGNGSYFCPTIRWPEGVSVVGIEPSYFEYVDCKCSPGYTGDVPNCLRAPPPNHLAAYILASVSTLSLGLLTYLVIIPQLRKYVQRNRDLHMARKQLELYCLGGNQTKDLLLDFRYSADAVIPEEWKIPYATLDFVRVVASGATASVSLALWNRALVAVKEFHTGAVSDDEMVSFIAECRVHASLRHPNVLQMLGVCTEPFCIVTEWMERGSLFHIIQSSPELIESPLQVAIDVSKGMLYLHSRGVLHRDLKSLNVLLNSKGSAKVADFGLSRVISDQTMTMRLGTSAWIAPEVFRGGNYDAKCDVYSYGIVLYELYRMRPPYEDMKFSTEIERFVLAGGRPIPPEDCPERIKALMVRCWAEDPMGRPTFEEITSELEAMEER